MQEKNHILFQLKTIKKMKKTIFLFSLILILTSLNAQRVLIEEDVASYDEANTKYGQNYRHYLHFYTDLAFFTPNPLEDQLEIKYGLSNSFTFGYRYKLKLTNWLAVGADIKHNSLIYNFKNTFKPFDEEINIEHDKDKLKLNSFGTEVYLRLNFGKRGNMIGKFIDFAGYINAIYSTKHIYYNTYASGNMFKAEEQKTINSKLQYIQPYFYGAKVRLGINKFVLSFDYQLSEIFTQEFVQETNNYNLPKFSIGLQIGLH